LVVELSEAGVSREVVGAILGHADGNVTPVYAPVRWSEKVAAVGHLGMWTIKEVRNSPEGGAMGDIDPDRAKHLVAQAKEFLRVNEHNLLIDDRKPQDQKMPKDMREVIEHGVKEAKETLRKYGQYAGE
jgi:hypothetical protein